MEAGLLERIFGGSTGPVLIYGEAGAGKTNIILEVLREASRKGGRGFYLSTEGAHYAARASMLEGLDNVLFAEAGSLSEQARLVSWIIPRAARPGDIVAIDTINSLYRLEAVDRDEAPHAFTLLGIQMASLYRIARGGVRVIIAGQVHGGGDEASGMWLARFWVERIFAVKREEKDRILVPLLPSGTPIPFRITGKGVILTGGNR